MRVSLPLSQCISAKCFMDRTTQKLRNKYVLIHVIKSKIRNLDSYTVLTAWRGLKIKLTSAATVHIGKNTAKIS